MLRRLTAVVLVCTAVLSVGCAKEKAPEFRILSDQEAADLWNKAESRDRVGEAVVKKIQNDKGTTVITTQGYTLRMPGGGSRGLVTVCGGGCTLEPGGTFGGCQHSGCMPSGNSCTPLVCSGDCRVSSPCRPEATIGIGGAYIASSSG